jgi:hypothetical protein
MTEDEKRAIIEAIEETLQLDFRLGSHVPVGSDEIFAAIEPLIEKIAVERAEGVRKFFSSYEIPLR